MIVIYESNEPFWIEGVMDALREEGFHPELADDAGTVYYRMDNKNPGVVGMPQGRLKVSIVVPRQEEAAAWLFLQKRDELAGSSVAELTGGLGRPLALSAMATAVAFILMACLSDEPGAYLVLSLILVFPASFILTASAVFVHNEIGQICVLIIMVTAVTVGMYCMDNALIYTGCFILCLPIVGIAYIFFRTHKYVRSRKKNNSS